MNSTRQPLRSRYRLAYLNIKNKRIFFDSLRSTAKSFIKSEKFEQELIDNGKAARMIQYRSYEYLYILKSYILSYNKLIKSGSCLFNNGQNFNEIFTKNNKNPDNSNNLLNAWNSFNNPVAVCLDQSKFDGHFALEYLNLFNNNFWKPLFSSKLLERLFKFQTCNKVYSQNGLKYLLEGYRLSGEYTTSDENSLLNFLIHYTVLSFLNIKNCKYFINGDDSVLIMEHSDSLTLLKSLELYKLLNMATTIETVAYDFRQIKFCQCSPIRIRGSYQLVKEPFRTMSRSSLCEYKYLKCINRYRAGVGLCELIAHQGVPILESFSKFMICSSNLVKPLGSVDKSSAITSGNVKYQNIVIDNETREDFSVAFGISIEQQLQMESDISRSSISSKNLEDYLNHYQTFHLH